MLADEPSNTDVQQLLLVMPVVPGALDGLRQAVQGLPAEYLSAALDRVGTVHSTRFVIFDDVAGGAKLAVVATFDGDADEYIEAFARELDQAFNLLLEFIADKPATPVSDRDNVRGFVDYVKARNRKPSGTAYRAYPGWTALDIGDSIAVVAEAAPARRVVPFSVRATPLSAFDLDEIQGLVIRGYRKDFARHLVVRVDAPRAFAKALSKLTEEDLESPFVTVATDWRRKPPLGRAARTCVNIGFTYDGLRELGVDEASLTSFPEAFRVGAAARAEQIGDGGHSAPEHWRASLAPGVPHAIISIFADTVDELGTTTDQVRTQFSAAANPIDDLPAHRLTARTSSTSAIGRAVATDDRGLEPRVGLTDPFPTGPPGEFVLGHPTQRPHPWEPTPIAGGARHNGSFAAFRVMSQDGQGHMTNTWRPSRSGAGIEPSCSRPRCAAAGAR